MAVGDHVHVYVDVKRDDPVGRSSWRNVIWEIRGLL